MLLLVRHSRPVSASHIVAGSIFVCGLSGLLAKGYHGENGGIVPGSIFWDSVSHGNHQGPVVVAAKPTVPSPPSYVIDCSNTAPWKHDRGAIVFLQLAFSLMVTVVLPVLLGLVRLSCRAWQQEIHRAGRSLGIDGFFSLRRRDLECERKKRRVAQVLRPPPSSARAHDFCWAGSAGLLSRFFNRNISGSPGPVLKTRKMQRSSEAALEQAHWRTSPLHGISLPPCQRPLLIRRLTLAQSTAPCAAGGTDRDPCP